LGSLSEASVNLSDVTAMGFSDMVLWAIRWDSDGRDITLRVKLGNGTRVELCCTWATNLSCNFEKRAHGGPLMTWDGSVDTAPDGTHEVRFDFASEGQMSLKCNDVTISHW
jgi:hypothetical protein